MKVAILAGGFGTRISEESQFKPKPMIEIGGMPILWHIMKHYSHYGFNEFVILGGYKQNFIKDYFRNYYLWHSDVTFDFSKHDIEYRKTEIEPWKVTVLDTGLTTNTGGRIRKAIEYLGGEAFMLTYGDAVCDIDIRKLLEFHKAGGKLLTLTAVSLAQNKGVLDIDEDGVINSFREKSERDAASINGGFMVCEPGVIDYIPGNVAFERVPLNNMVRDHQVDAFFHTGFWHCMDTKRDKDELEALWASGEAPWVTWEK